MKQFMLAVSLGLCLIGISQPGQAGQAANDATTHFQAIAGGDQGLLMLGYKDDAQLQWLGGPLDGTYVGSAAIKAVWAKLGKAQGPLTATVEALEESENPKGSTVKAKLLFVGKAPIKVRYVLVYRDKLIVSETWQIDPKLAIGAAAPSPTY